jgi:hypothetical protein
MDYLVWNARSCHSNKSCTFPWLLAAVNEAVPHNSSLFTTLSLLGIPHTKRPKMTVYVDIVDATRNVFAKMPIVTIKPAMLHNTALKCRNRASKSTSLAFGRAEV